MNIFKVLRMFRFGQVAYAVGLGEPALRNWMRRNAIDLFEPRPESGWRSFHLNDVYVLAVAVELVKFGAQVKPAVDAVRTALGLANFETLEGMPTHLFAGPYQDRWTAGENENVVRTMCGPTVISVELAIVMRDAQRRLNEYSASADERRAPVDDTTLS